MIDAMTRESIRVSTDGEAGPYIMTPVSRLEEICRLLDAHGVSYWVEEDAISLDGAPEIAVVNLGHGSKATTVQSLLDTIQ